MGYSLWGRKESDSTEVTNHVSTVGSTKAQEQLQRASPWVSDAEPGRRALPACRAAPIGIIMLIFHLLRNMYISPCISVDDLIH